MQRCLMIRVLAAAALVFSGTGHAQVADPIPQPIEKSGLVVRVTDFARLPRTSGLRNASGDVAPDAWARVSFVRDLPDGRRFANDSRGFLYVLDSGGEPSLYADIGAAFPRAFYNSLESGFIGFAFHPQFEQNGFFYTVHGEYAIENPATPDFIPPGFGIEDVTYHNVLTEWRANDPAANSFDGSHRELLRVAHVVDSFFHAVGYVGFDPTAEPGDADYGLLYTSGSDLGFSNGGGPNAANPGQTQRLDTLVGAILRIDPRSPSESGGARGVGDYTIPPQNPFAADDDPTTLGEIYAYGFRNAHRLSWDIEDGTMFAAEIGMSQVEEINIVHEGNNYGWMQREGIFDNGVNMPSNALNLVYALPDDILDGRRRDQFSYPVAIYDHGEGQAVSGGFPYRGTIPALRGKFVFGDIANGRLFAADLEAMKEADDNIPRTVADVEEIQLYRRDESGDRQNVTLMELIQEAMPETTITRADLQISRTRDGELFITSRQDGMIRMLAPD